MLQQSGQMAIIDIQNEFGGSAPIHIDEYYAADNGIPGGGTIAFSDFYGKVKPLTFDTGTFNQCIDHYATLYYDGNGHFYVESRQPDGSIHCCRGDCGGYAQGQILRVAFNKTGQTSVTFTAYVNGGVHFNNVTLNVNSEWRGTYNFTDGSGGAHIYNFRIVGSVT